MKNKEIEELLNKLKKCRDYDDEVLLIKQHGATLLLSHIEQLEKEIEEYQKELEKADSITQSCIFNGKKDSEISYRKCLNMLERLKKEKKQLENNKDKAIKKLNKYRNRKDHYGLWCMEYIDNADIIHILKGDGDE